MRIDYPVLSALLIAACAAPDGTRRAEQDRELAGLRAYEESARSATDFARQPTSDRSLGPNPYQLERLAGGGAVGLLRGADALVLLDDRGAETARIATPPSPTALLVDPDGFIWVGGTGSPELAIYRAHPLAEVARFQIDEAWTVRALALSGDLVVAADERTGTVTAIERRGRAQRPIGRCRQPIGLARSAGHLIINCLYDHALVAHPVDDLGRPTGGEPIRIVHDGPIWSLAASGDLIAAGGVEDHPLVRKDGGFGYIDSFLYVYELPSARRLAEVNLSAEGVVTPKWLELEVAGATARVTTAGYATALLAEIAVPLAGGAPVVTTHPFLPGSTDREASPLLDAWLVGGEAVRVPGTAPRTLESRVGEALLFTTLMAPWNSSDGSRSRFTCETCHFEAYGDGRVHFTGRGTVHAATKPLRGLWSNRPHFTRALDRSTTQMVHAEFRVANRFNGRDPWFAVGPSDVPWLAELGVRKGPLSPVFLRRALLTFLAELTFEPNQAVRGRSRFDHTERAGAALFRDRCETCHRARLVAEDPKSAVPFGRWEELIFSPAGPIVWASAEYRKTGVEPYVHDEGARTTSLRRLGQKQPYFTSGSARTPAEVLERAAWVGDRFFHDQPPAGAARLSPDERAALLAFLALL